jgi:SAM-dependent methyltransferase
MRESVEFECRHCQGRLVSGDFGLVCGWCGGKWPIVKGIPRFNRDIPYWGEIPQSAMLKCLQVAETSDWRSAVREICSPISPSLVSYITDSRRVNWFYLLPRSVRTVLDLGAGWGTISANLAPHVERVVALEGVTERIEFVALRCRQDALRNVIAIQSDFRSVPIVSSSFDLIVANGVLEWVGLANGPTDPRELQKRFLRQMWRLLRPGGSLYIGIENRLGYNNFLGAKDHSGLPFTGLLPRRLADVTVRRLRQVGVGARYRTDNGQTGYRTYTYSLKGYRTLFHEAGFSHVQAYAALPSYNDPRFLLPLSSRHPEVIWRHFVENWAQTKSLKQRAMLGAVGLASKLHLTRMVERVVPSFALFAERSSG